MVMGKALFSSTSFTYSGWVFARLVFFYWFYWTISMGVFPHVCPCFSPCRTIFPVFLWKSGLSNNEFLIFPPWFIHECIHYLFFFNFYLFGCASFFFYNIYFLFCKYNLSSYVLFFLLKHATFKFIYFWLHWVFIAVHGLSLVVVSRGYSSLLCVGFSLQWLLLLWSTGYRHPGFVAQGLSCSAVCGIFPDHGSNPCPLHWQADS